MNKLQFAILWEEQGSETVVYGPFETWDDAEIYKNNMLSEIGLDIEKDDPIDFGHNFQVINFVEVKQ